MEIVICYIKLMFLLAEQIQGVFTWSWAHTHAVVRVGQCWIHNCWCQAMAASGHRLLGSKCWGQFIALSACSQTFSLDPEGKVMMGISQSAHIWFVCDRLRRPLVQERPISMSTVHWQPCARSQPSSGATCIMQTPLKASSPMCERPRGSQLTLLLSTSASRLLPWTSMKISRSWCRPKRPSEPTLPTFRTTPQQKTFRWERRSRWTTSTCEQQRASLWNGSLPSKHSARLDLGFVDTSLALSHWNRTSWNTEHSRLISRTLIHSCHDHVHCLVPTNQCLWFLVRKLMCYVIPLL